MTKIFLKESRFFGFMETQNISELEKEVLGDAKNYLEKVKAFQEKRGSYPTTPKNDAEQIASTLCLSRLPPLSAEFGKNAVYSITEKDILDIYRRNR